MKTPYQIADLLGIEYSGDMNIEYGGLFYSLDDFSDGYASAVRVTDLDSSCGFTGGIMIECGSINIPDDMAERQSALDCCGQDVKPGDDGYQRILIESLEAYAGIEVTRDYGGDHRETLTTDPDSWQYDGWQASKHVESADLLGYLFANQLSTNF